MTTDNALFDVAQYVDVWSLADRFGVPPFSTLDTRSGRWQARRAVWDQLELDSDNGRGPALTFAKNQGSDPVSQKLAAVGGTSIFDPVLCELIYRWWSPANGVILDPFAGGSVRGIVAATMGRHYLGVDLSTVQIGANLQVAKRLADRLTGSTQWFWQDSSQWQPDVDVDLVLSCPPYGTLERYSDDPRDLSTMKFDTFAPVYRRAIAMAVDRLRSGRFAVFVVGNYREANRFCDLVGLTVDAFEEAGAAYYADLVLLNATSTAGMRASASFNAGRKPIMVHQHVLVFVKGDWHQAAAAAERIDPLDERG